jgi:hypothetical protein
MADPVPDQATPNRTATVVRAVLVPLPKTLEDLLELAAHAEAAGFAGDLPAIIAQDVTRKLANDFLVTAWTPLPAAPSSRWIAGNPVPRIALAAVTLVRASKILADRATSVRDAGGNARLDALALQLLTQELNGGAFCGLGTGRIGYLVGDPAADRDAAAALQAAGDPHPGVAP